MGTNVFSVTVFFLVFRETLEASLVVSVLLSLVTQIVHDDKNPLPSSTDEKQPAEEDGDDVTRKRRLLRKLRLQVWFPPFPLFTCTHVASSRSSLAPVSGSSSHWPSGQLSLPYGSLRRPIYGQNRRHFGKVGCEEPGVQQRKLSVLQVSSLS